MSITYIDVRELNRAYQAGIFDGEGTCFRERMHLKVGIAQANIPFLEAFKDEFGGSVYKTSEGNWQWSLTDAPSQLVFLRAISPYVKLKAREVAICIEICKIMPGRGAKPDPRNQLLRERLFEMLKEAAELRINGYREPLNEAESGESVLAIRNADGADIE